MKARPFILILVYLCLSYPLFAGSTKQATTQSSSTSATVPALRYATYLGRTSADVGNSVAVGADGSLYVAGNAAPTAANGHNEAFVAHLSADGSTVLYIAYLGGNDDTEARALTLDSVGNVYVTGETRALNFPVRNALQAHCSTDAARTCSGNAFLSKLNPDGTVAFSTYWGGSGEDGANAIALDASGNIYIAGATTSTNLPVLNSFQGTAGGGGDAFIAKFAGDGSRVLYATYLGGRGADEIRAIAMDAKGSVYVTGQTHSVDFPTQKGIQVFCRLDAQNACNGEAFVAKLAADGSSLFYSTYLGGSNGDAGNAIAVDASGSAYVTGVTSSADFPLSQPLSSTFRGQSKAFLTKLAASGSALIYSTYLGGSGADAGLGIALNPTGNVFVAGQTNSSDFPILNAVQSACAKASNGICSGDAFVAVIDPTGSRLQFGSYIGGSRSDAAHGIAVDSQDSVYVAGATTSFDLPSAKPAQLSSSNNGGQAAAAGSPTSAMTAGAFAAKMAGLSISGAAGGLQQQPPPASNCSANSTNWLGGTGNWSNAGSWSTAIVPNSPSVNVCIDNGNAVNSQVTLDIPVTVGTLTIDSGDSLTISDNNGLTVDGNISNAGVLSVSSAGSNTFLHIGGAVTLSGGGTLTMSNSGGAGGAFINEAANGSILTNADNTIQGFGQIGNNGLGLVNQTGGTITANIAGKGLTINSAGVTNQGLLEAANGGVLALFSATYNNAGGNITANGSGSTVTLVSANIQAGMLTSSGGGLLGVSGGNAATLDGSTAGGTVKIVGPYTIGDNSGTTIAGTINNTGSILISAAGNNTFLHVNGAVNLTGAGTVTMSNSGASGGAFINEASNGSILTNVNNTIQGFGQIGNNGLGLVNQVGGTIDANSTGNGLDLDPAGATNQGLLEATNGGILVLDGTTFNNAGANITSSGSGSIVELVNGTTVQAGNLNTALGGVLGVPLNGSATLDGSTAGGPVNNTGTFTMPNNSSTTIAGTINNTGSILITSAGSVTILHVNGGVSLTGAGTVTMSNTGSSGGAFINEASNGSVLTNVNNLIQGFGQIGNNSLALVNQAAGVINANVAGKSLDLDPAGATNLGILEATNGGQLVLDSTTFNNTGANITSSGAGSNVALINATIQAGTLTATGGGLLGVQAGNAATLDGSTAGGAVKIVGPYTIGDNSGTTIAGTINNTGSILISSAGNNTFLHVNGLVTLMGAGAVTMSSSGAMGSAFINEASNGSVLTNASNTIQGFGQIGNNGLVLINQATINANGALGQGLNLNPPTLTNAGLLEATGGGILQLTNGTISNSAGTIQVSGATSAVQFANSVTIQGGTLSTLNSGVLGVSAGNSMTLDGATLGKLTIVGTFTIADNSSTTIAGTINNTGSILISSAGNNTFLHVNGLVTLMGAGAVTMSSSGAMGSAFINEASNGSVLTNASNTIQGFGQIGNNGLVLINQATINANGALGQGLNLNPPTLTNAGLLEATGGGILQLTNGTINNSAGTIQVSGATSAVQFAANVTIQAGTLATVNNGVLGVSAGNTMTLDGATLGKLNLAGTFTIADNSSTTIAGTINNTGSILISSAGNNTFLHVNGPVTLMGAGVVTMSNTGTFGGAFINEASNGSVLMLAGSTIQGFGQIGNNGLVLINQGTINANSAAAKALNLNPPTLTNQGVLEATGGGVLQLTNATIANNGGTIAVNGATSSIQFASGVAIQGGTLTTTNSGVLGSVTGNSVTLDGTANALAISAGSTYTVANNSTTNILGTINNAGTILLAGAANPTFLTVPAGAVATLTGAGTVTLSGNANNILNGATLNNSGNTIKSLGTFSVGSFTQSGGLLQVPVGATANPGAFALNGGTAQVDGTLSVASGVSVTATGLLIGTGAVTPSVTSGGSVQAGDAPAPGILTINGGAGNYSQVAAGTYNVLIGGPTAGTQFSQLNLTGAASLAGTLNASLINGFTPTSGQSFNILKSGSLSGQFSATNLPALGNGLTWQVNYSATGVTLSVAGGAGAALGISKSHVGNFAQGQQGATYTVVVSNAQGSGSTSGTVTVTELAPSGLTLVSMAGTGWTCGAPNPVNVCTRGDALAGGANYPAITVTVNVAANATSPQMNMVNVSGGGSLTANATDSTTITGGAASPALTIAKAHTGNFTQGQHSAQYTVTVSNGANAGPTSGTVTVTDTTLTSLAQDIATSFSGTANPNGVWSYGQYVESPAAFTLLPGQNAAFPTCGLPYWSGAGYPDVIANNTGSTVTCGTVTVPNDVLWMHPTDTAGTDGAVRWTAPAAGTYEITGSFSALDSTSTLDSILVNGASVFSTFICNPGNGNTCATVNTLAPFSIVQTLAAGSTVDFIVNCCSGADQDFLFDSTGLTGAIDSNLSGLSLVSMSGTGWTCVANSCTRGDALAPGATYPPITVLVNVGSSAPSPQVNTVNLTGGGSTPASSSDSTVINAKPPLLSIAKSHVGNFTQGQQGATYTATVSNGPNAGPTSGTVTVTDNIPSGLTLVSMTGAGWSCQTNTCTRGDALNSGASYPPISVTVNVTTGATSPQVNAVSVSGGGSATANANDPTVITSTGTPALSISKTHVGNFTQGQQGAHYTVTVTNGANAGPTNNTVSVVDTTPDGLTFVSMSGTGWVCGVPNPANDCTRNDALAAGASYPPITVTVNVTASATSPQVNAASVSGGGSATANANDPTVITPTGTPALSIAKSHSGDFAIGQPGAQYTLIVSNAANSGPTNNTVSVVDAIPDGLTLVSMSGAGWTCGVPNPVNDCTRNEALAAGASYPAITVVVNVTANSPAIVVNMASVSGGGSATASASDSTNLVAVPFTLVIVPPAGGSPGTPLPVSPGGQVAIGLLLTPIPGFTGTVTFSCASSAPQFITCAPAPSQVKLSPSGTQVAIVVNTFCQGDVPLYGPGPGGLGGGLALLLAAGMLGSITWAYRRRSRWALSFAVLLLIALGNAACSNLPSGPSGRTPAGNYTLTITASANGQSAQVQQQIQVTH